MQKVFAVDVWLPGARLTQPCHFNYFLMWLWSNSESTPLFNICCRKAAWGSEPRRIGGQRATNRKPAVWEMTKEEGKNIHKSEDSLKRKTLENDPYDLYNWANYKHSWRRTKISEKKQVVDFMRILFCHSTFIRRYMNSIWPWLLEMSAKWVYLMSNVWQLNAVLLRLSGRSNPDCASDKIKWNWV